MTTTFETASLGDRVWCLTSGWGTITHTFYGDKVYPIAVKFDSGERETFTKEGLLYTSNNYQTLFWDEVEIKAPTKPLHKLNKDDCVEVWYTNTDDQTIPYKRHFSHFEDGIIFCFKDGGTSWTSTQTVGWGRWRKPK